MYHRWTYLQHVSMFSTRTAEAYNSFVGLRLRLIFLLLNQRLKCDTIRPLVVQRCQGPLTHSCERLAAWLLLHVSVWVSAIEVLETEVIKVVRLKFLFFFFFEVGEFIHTLVYLQDSDTLSFLSVERLMKSQNSAKRLRCFKQLNYMSNFQNLRNRRYYISGHQVSRSVSKSSGTIGSTRKNDTYIVYMYRCEPCCKLSFEERGALPALGPECRWVIELEVSGTKRHKGTSQNS